MSRKIVFMFISICLFVCVNLNANEKVKIKENSSNNNNYHVSFSEVFKDVPSYGLVEKMARYDDDDDEGYRYKKLPKAKDMFYLGIAGAVVAGVSLVSVIVGAALFAVGMTNMYTTESYQSGYSSYPVDGIGWSGTSSTPTYSNRNVINPVYNGMYLAGASLLGVFNTLLLVGIVMTAVGFALNWYFGKKAKSVAMFMENRKGVVLANDNHYQNNQAMGIRFSF